MKRNRLDEEPDEQEAGNCPVPDKQTRRVDYSAAFKNPILISVITQYLTTLEDITDFANTCSATRRHVPKTKLPFNFKFVVKWTGFWEKRLRHVGVNRNWPRGDIAQNFMKSVVVCIDPNYSTAQPGQVGYRNPTIDKIFIKQMLACINAEKLKIVSVGFNVHHCNSYFTVDKQKIAYKKLKHVHLEDVHVSFESLPSGEGSYRTFNENTPRCWALSEQVIPTGLLHVILQSKTIETIKLISVIMNNNAISCMQEILDRNYEITLSKDKFLKNVVAIHLEDVVLSSPNHNAFDNFMCDLISTTDVVPVLSLQLHKHAYGASLIKRLGTLNKHYTKINLLISLDALNPETLESIDRLQRKTHSLKLQFYEPNILEIVDFGTIEDMFNLWSNWRNVDEVVVGKELYSYCPLRTVYCQPIVTNLPKLPNLKILGVADQNFFTLFISLSTILDYLTITHLTLSCTDHFRTREFVQFSNPMFMQMMVHLPKTLTHFSACALPLTAEVIDVLAEWNHQIRHINVVQSFSIRCDMVLMRSCFEKANNDAEITFQAFDFAKSKFRTTPVTHWLNIDRSNPTECPVVF
ncbi:unnamed protein product [Caenorhabditis sp. 36 PRJEB53466]|nr:unnamed protein product [Caenorhabditis sp. 36 PRJEB53466]